MAVPYIGVRAGLAQCLPILGFRWSGVRQIGSAIKKWKHGLVAEKGMQSESVGMVLGQKGLSTLTGLVAATTSPQGSEFLLYVDPYCESGL